MGRSCQYTPLHYSPPLSSRWSRAERQTLTQALKHSAVPHEWTAKPQLPQKCQTVELKQHRCITPLDICPSSVVYARCWANQQVRLWFRVFERTPKYDCTAQPLVNVRPEAGLRCGHTQPLVRWNPQPQKTKNKINNKKTRPFISFTALQLFLPASPAQFILHTTSSN